MKTEKTTESPLTPQDVRRILKACAPDALLVGGQALAFWADFLAVGLPADLESGVTSDADFIGNAALARHVGEALGWNTWIPRPDDSTPQTGKVTRELADGSVKQVDFLAHVIGLSTPAIQRRAIELEVPEIGTLRIMHPLDVLDSRIQNLHRLPSKRNAAGIAQARLAIDMARAFIRSEVLQFGERAALKLLERIVRIGASAAGRHVFLRHDIDPLTAVPLDAFRTSTALHQRRWPQIQRDIARQRESLRKNLARRRRD